MWITCRLLSDTQKTGFPKGLPAAGTPRSTGGLPKGSCDFKRTADVPTYKEGVQICFFSYQCRTKGWEFWKSVGWEAADLNALTTPQVKF